MRGATEIKQTSEIIIADPGCCAGSHVSSTVVGHAVRRNANRGVSLTDAVVNRTAGVFLVWITEGPRIARIIPGVGMIREAEIQVAT